MQQHLPLNPHFVTQVITAAQSGEAPDLLRLSHDHLGEIGHMRVGGLPLLEDLRPVDVGNLLTMNKQCPRRKFAASPKFLPIPPWR